MLPFVYSIFYLNKNRKIRTWYILIFLLPFLLISLKLSGIIWFFIGSIYSLSVVVLIIFVERLFKLFERQLKVSSNTDVWSRLSDILLSVTKILKFFQWRILLSSLAVWILLASIGMLSDLRFSYNWLNILMIILLFIMINFFLLGKLSVFANIKDRSQKVGRLTIRSLVICFFGLIYSFSLGLYFIDKAAKDSFENSEYLDGFFSEARLNINFKSRLGKAPLTKLDSMYSIKKVNIDFIQSKNDSLIAKRLEEITSYIQNKKERIKFLNTEILPHLKDVNKKYFICYKPSVQIYHMKFEWYVLPDILVFYSFISVIFGLLLEIGTREKLIG